MLLKKICIKRTIIKDVVGMFFSSSDWFEYNILWIGNVVDSPDV